ncbi:MAG: rod shape-determining protein MreD [Clostridia bacterium]|jgi:rod shape-determining protein mreD
MKKALSILCLILTFFIIYFLQANFFTWFNIATIMPNVYVILVLFIGLFVKRKIGLACGIGFGLYLDIVLGKTIGTSALALGIVGLLGEILSKNFSKDSRFIVCLMVIGTTAVYETIVYLLTMLRTEGTIEILAFLRILLIEMFFNGLITIIIYPLIKKAGYYLENLYDDKFILTRYF